MATKLINYNDVHVVAESSYLQATYGMGRILSMVVDEDIDNGKLLAKGDYIKPEIYQGVTPTANSQVYLVLNPATIAESYTSAMQAEKYFYNAASDSEKGYYNGLRCYPLFANDVFTVSAIGIKAIAKEPVVGNYVVADGKDIKEVAKGTTPTAAFYGKIIEAVTKSDGIHYRIEVIKNA